MSILGSLAVMRLACSATALRVGTVALLTALVASSAGNARAQDGGWEIASFDVRLKMAHDGDVEVTETILARFEVPKHGIFREIPVRYAVGAHLYDLRMHLLGVTDAQGQSWKYSLRDEANKVVIKVGRKDTTLTGEQTYVIKYRVDRAVLWEGEHAVLRWNATGTEWRVPIGRSSVTVVFPLPIPDDQVQADAWTGRFGATQKDFTKARVDDRTLVFTTRRLGPGEGITVDVAIPATAVVQPSLASRIWWWLSDNFPYGLIPLGLAGCFLAWWRRGRDVPGMGTIVVQYQPPEGLKPAEVGTLIDESVDLRDISATIIDLAVRGYLRIEEKSEPRTFGFGSKTDYTFVSKGKDTSDLKYFELQLYNQIFAGRSSVELSALQNKFFAILPMVKDELYGSLSGSGYFDGNPNSVRTTFMVGGWVVAALAIALAAFVQWFSIGRVFPAPLIVAGIVLAVAVALTSYVMPRRTRKGRIAWEQIRGLEEYISRAEVDDLKAQERQNVFERLLPYAIAFGLTSRWSSAFEGLYTQAPDWYRTPSNQFNMVYFGDSLDRSVGAMNRTFPTQPRSEGSSGWSSGGFSGGGSSGGGFGGGGGGSW